MSSERAVLYARVSGDDHDEASRLDAQIGMCREYAEKQGYTILHEFQEDKYSSGADLALPHLNEVLDLARNGAFDVLVCRATRSSSRAILRAISRVGVGYAILVSELGGNWSDREAQRL